MIKGEELIGITEYLTLYTMCRINRCPHNRLRLSFVCFGYKITGSIEKVEGPQEARGPHFFVTGLVTNRPTVISNITIGI
jgi:hypothetical protein